MLDRTFPVPAGESWDPERSVAATSREMLPAAIALLVATVGNPYKALVEAASFGRDADTIASVVGCFVGALGGADALPKDWIDDCERANAAFFLEFSGDAGACKPV
jgi:ADP-ribosylglycohydrolase